jgi:aerobic-type carbon monoxide dehydrogenase small subunit (CoxS/CutS family)
MANEVQLRVNDTMRTVTAAPETPLLYVLTDDLALHGPRFGCGLGQCGCCSVLADGVEIRSCITPLSRVVGKSVTTLEGLPAYYAARMKLSRPPALHPLQEALVAEQAVQCGYCYNGQIIKGAELLFRTAASHRGANPVGDERAYMPVRDVPADSRGDSTRFEGDGRKARCIFGRNRRGDPCVRPTSTTPTITRLTTRRSWRVGIS